MATRWPLVCALAALTVGGAPAAAEDEPAGRTWLGIGIDSGVSGVRITQVFPLTPAFAAGLEEGDEIVAVGTRRVVSTSDLQQNIGPRRAGSSVSVEVARGGNRFRVAVVLEIMPSLEERLARILVGKSAPAVTLDPVAGPRVRDFAELRGRVVVIAFVATWDEVSRATVDALAALAGDHGQELAVVVVSQESPDALRGFASRISGTVAVAHDPNGRAGRAYLVENDKQPQLVVIDARGVIRHAAASATAPGTDAAEGRDLQAELIDGALFAARRELRRAARVR